MNSPKLNDWIQTAGMIAVVISLIFVGLQMRQTREFERRAVVERKTRKLSRFVRRRSRSIIRVKN